MKIINRFLFVFLIIDCTTTSEKSKYLFRISFSDVLSYQAQDGGLLLMISNNNENEPRFQINDGLNTQLIFGVDVENMNYISRLRYNTMCLSRILERIRESAPKDADLTSWRY